MRLTNYFAMLLPLLRLVLAQNCAMDIWVFDSLERCNDINPPNADGVIYADNTCRTVETETSTSDSDYNLFPGTYRAYCTDKGEIHFAESGCVDNTCSGESNGVCERDLSIGASLFSRLDPPEFIVQDRADATPGGFYTCLRLLGKDISVSFVIFGDCSECNPGSEPSPTDPPEEPTDSPVEEPTSPPPTPRPSREPTTLKPTISPTPGETPEPTLKPTRKPTLEPTSEPSLQPTDSPTQLPTSAPIIAGEPTREPTTKAPTTKAPTKAPTTKAPTKAPTTKAPTLLPTKIPTSSPVDTPTTSLPVLSPTGMPSLVTGTTTPEDLPTLQPNAGNLTSDRVSVAMKLSPMEATLQDSGLSLWEGATKLQIQDSAKNSDINVVRISFAEITQELVQMSRRRYLQSGLQSLQINFDLSMSYYTDTNPVPTVAEIFRSAFDTEQERSNYLLKLVPNDASFESVRLIQIIQDDNNIVTPAPAPQSNGSSAITGEGGGGDSVSAGLIAGVVCGAVVCLAVIGGGFFFYRRKDNEKYSSPGTRSKEGSPSSDDDQYRTGSSTDPSRQRWTNEILVDPSADDVSTLGGSVLAGLNLAEGGANTAEDEPTASVNLDYDYGRETHQNDHEERSRSVTETSGTAFTNYSKLGMLGDSVFADDMSFEQQYFVTDEANEQDRTRLRPFEVRAPPGMLGMVVDTPNGSVPIVRAIKPDSILQGKVKIGDRLLSVDHQDVTKLSALEVSSLISMKQNKQRLLIFVRLEDKSGKL